MTAEVVIMNKGAVALAADSAVTVPTQSGDKVYNTVDKLFSLSREAPVGVMIWGGSELCGVPWEVLIKEYRRELGGKRFESLSEYCSDLREFVSGSRFLTDDLQKISIFRHAQGFFSGYVIEQIPKLVQKHTDEYGPITVPQLVQLITDVLVSREVDLDAENFVDGFDTPDLERLVSTYLSQIDDAMKSVFEDLPIGDENTRMARRIFALFCCKQTLSAWHSGLVVAGFGEQDIFPKAVSYTVDGYFLDRPKFIAQDGAEVSPENSAVIMPFAQQEMVSLFMEGVDPKYRDAFTVALTKSMKELPNAVAAVIGAEGDARKQVTELLRQAIENIPAAFEEQMESYSRSTHVNPIIEAVAALPKDQLGAMAESLVNLTSFKRRVTLDAETVGGAIDVAVISKGDGFIWLKRKHYFEPERNPQFMARYNKGKLSDGES